MQQRDAALKPQESLFVPLTTPCSAGTAETPDFLRFQRSGAYSASFLMFSDIIAILLFRVKLFFMYKLLRNNPRYCSSPVRSACFRIETISERLPLRRKRAGRRPANAPQRSKVSERVSCDGGHKRHFTHIPESGIPCILRKAGTSEPAYAFH